MKLVSLNSHILFSLYRYESGTLGKIWPLGCVTLSLHNPFLTNIALASAVLDDVSYPETHVVLEDLHLAKNQSVQPLRAVAKRRVRYGHHLLLFYFSLHANFLIKS